MTQCRILPESVTTYLPSLFSFLSQVAEVRYSRSPLDGDGRPELRENPGCESHTSGYLRASMKFSPHFPLLASHLVNGESLHVLLLTDCDIVKTAAGKAVLLLHIQVHVCRETV
jgi:hypothetical protein